MWWAFKEKAWRRASQVSVKEMSENNPLMRCRNQDSNVETRVRVDPRDEFKRKPVYCLNGVRHRGGMNLIQAYIWNVRTCFFLMIREKLKWIQHKSQSTKAENGGGWIRSSDEAPVMGVERREETVQLNKLNNWNNQEESMSEARLKPFNISREAVWEA